MGYEASRTSTGSSRFIKCISVLGPRSTVQPRSGDRGNESRIYDGMFVFCAIPSDYQVINSLDYERVLLRRVTNDHCSVDTPSLVTYVQGATAGRRRHQFVPLFF